MTKRAKPNPTIISLETARSKRPTQVNAANGRGFTVTAVSVSGGFAHEVPAATWGLAVRLARQLRKEYSHRTILISDGVHIWPLEELEASK